MSIPRHVKQSPPICLLFPKIINTPAHVVKTLPSRLFIFMSRIVCIPHTRSTALEHPIQALQARHFQNAPIHKRSRGHKLRLKRREEYMFHRPPYMLSPPPHFARDLNSGTVIVVSRRQLLRHVKRGQLAQKHFKAGLLLVPFHVWAETQEKTRQLG